MWASSWAICGLVGGGKKHAWSCHSMEHELSAIYDITHGLGLAILTPRWMEYTLDDRTTSKYSQYGVHVFGIDSGLKAKEIAKKAIEHTRNFFFETLALKSTFAEIGIDEKYFDIMAKKACGGGTLAGFKPLNEQDIKNIFRMCL
jgi:alcohol dehydrogenase YqhD (iron-dependent ADH family)